MPWFLSLASNFLHHEVLRVWDLAGLLQSLQTTFRTQIGGKKDHRDRTCSTLSIQGAVALSRFARP
eukprot:9858114-Karenia_brevis.AAC.1